MIVDERKRKTLLPRLLRKALQLFVKQGIHATTTKDIAKAARVAEGTIYRHFESKDDMAWYLFHTHLSDLTEHLFAAVAKESGLHKQLGAAIHCFYEYYEQDSVLFHFILLSRHQELRRYTTEGKMGPRDVVLQILTDGKRNGEIVPVDTELAVAFVLGLVIQVAEARAYGRIRKDLRQFVKPVAQACLNALRK